jgi:S-adenosylmethionine hydrolase
LAVVDPGVGSQRKPIVIETEDAIYVGPDNGLLSFAARSSRVIHTVELSNTDYYLKPTSSTFHGRDIFSPAAAHIAMGTPARQLGKPIDTFMTLEWPRVEQHGSTLSGEVIYVDHFGNLISNIRADDLGSISGKPVVTIQDTRIDGLSSSYRGAGPGNYLAILNSWGLLEISRCSGNARVGLGADVGSIVKVTALDV